MGPMSQPDAPSLPQRFGKGFIASAGIPSQPNFRLDGLLPRFPHGHGAHHHRRRDSSSPSNKRLTISPSMSSHRLLEPSTWVRGFISRRAFFLPFARWVGTSLAWWPSTKFSPSPLSNRLLPALGYLQAAASHLLSKNACKAFPNTGTRIN